MSLTNGFNLDHNPCFQYQLAHDPLLRWCVPDALIHINAPQNFQGIIVTEVKLTYTPEALQKLLNLYCPVVSIALGVPVRPLVIFKNALRPNVEFKPCLDLYEAVHSSIPIFQWLGRGPLTYKEDIPLATSNPLHNIPRRS